MSVTIVTQTGYREAEQVIVKANGWIKYKKDGEIHHYPPHRIKALHEREPDTKQLEYSDAEKLESDIVYQSPHGRV